MRREFTKATKAAAFLRANGKCEGCGARLTIGKFHFDHDNPDGLTGHPTLDNCRVLCVGCHSRKTRADVARIAKAKRVQSYHIAGRQSHNPLPCGKHSPWKRKMNGQLVRRDMV